jgi:hypothetical protein
MLAVVDLHGLRIDVRLERREIVGQGRQRVRHNPIAPWRVVKSIVAE